MHHTNTFRIPVNTLQQIIEDVKKIEEYDLNVKQIEVEDFLVTLEIASDARHGDTYFVTSIVPVDSKPQGSVCRDGGFTGPPNTYVVGK